VTPPPPPPPHDVAVALLPWGNVIDEFLDSIGVSMETFVAEFTGSWMFRYVAALREAGVRTVLVFVSARVDRPTRVTHGPTGATMHFLPAGRLHRLLRSRMRLPFGPEGNSVRQAFGPIRGLKLLAYPFLVPARELVLYVSTPLGPLRRVLREERCGVMLCQEYEYPRFDVCVALGTRLGLPVFGTFQGGDYRRNHLEPWFRPIAMRRCAGVIIGSEREAARVREMYRLPPERIARIFNPVDVRPGNAVAGQTARARLGIPADARVVVWHGRVSLWPKGLDVLLAAWDRVRTERPAHLLRLLLVGTGPDAGKLEERIGRAPRPDIHWVREFVHDPNLIRGYLAAGDVYAFPSRHEGFPVAPLEAMAAGLPVVAADAQGIADIFEGGEASGGVIVPREDAEALAAALGRLLDDDDLRRELGRRARARAEVAFSLEAVGGQLSRFLGVG
jgi:starch synthase